MRKVRKFKWSLILLACIWTNSIGVSFGTTNVWSPSVKSFHNLVRSANVSKGTPKACVYAKDVPLTTKEINNSTEEQLIALIVQRSEYVVRTQPCSNLANELSGKLSPKCPKATVEPGVKEYLQSAKLPSSEGEAIDKKVTLKFIGDYIGEMAIDVHIVSEVGPVRKSEEPSGTVRSIVAQVSETTEEPEESEPISEKNFVSNNVNETASIPAEESDNTVSEAMETNTAILLPEDPKELEINEEKDIAFTTILILAIAAICAMGFGLTILSDLRLIFWYNRRK